MAEKKIVELNQTSERIVAILDDVDQNFAIVKENASNAITKATSLEGTVGDLATTVGSQDNEIEQNTKDIKGLQAIAATYDLTYTDDWLSLRKTQDGVTTEVSKVNIVSASDVVSSVITVTRITPASNTVTLEEPGEIEYKVESLQDGVETGDITVTWKINGVTALVETVKQGTNKFKLADRVSAGNNSITATFVDTIGTSYTGY